jgi:hypothetical protein
VWSLVAAVVQHADVSRPILTYARRLQEHAGAPRDGAAALRAHVHPPRAGPAQQVPAVQRRVFAPLVADVTQEAVSDIDTLGGARLRPAQRIARTNPGSLDVAHQVPQVPQVGPAR